MNIKENQQIKYLDVSLRILGVTLDTNTLTKIIKSLKLIKEKGGEATLEDVLKLNK